MKHAWDNYVRYAWGKNELEPISKRSHGGGVFGSHNLGATIVDGLDTLYIMNLTEEYQQGRNWIHEHLDLTNVVSIYCLHSQSLVKFTLTHDLMSQSRVNSPRKRDSDALFHCPITLGKGFLKFVIVSCF